MGCISSTKHWYVGRKKRDSLRSTTMPSFCVSQCCSTLTLLRWMRSSHAKRLRMADWVSEYEMIRIYKTGTLVFAYALYWEAIIRLRQFSNWSTEDAERFQFLIKFLKSRAVYSPSTFSHKVLFLEGFSPVSRFIKQLISDLVNKHQRRSSH